MSIPREVLTKLVEKGGPHDIKMTIHISDAVPRKAFSDIIEVLEREGAEITSVSVAKIETASSPIDKGPATKVQRKRETT